MAIKTLKTKIINKHDTAANWAKSSYIPSQAEIIIFDIDKDYSYERFKIGDGVHTVNELDFIDKHLLDKIENLNIPSALSELTADSTHRVVTDSQISTWNAKSNFSGSYTDLTNKPTLGSLAAKSTVAKSDLASAVQTSLSKADTALQSFTETDPTVPAWAKAASKPTYTASEVGAVPTSRTINGKALSSNITISASDLNAYTKIQIDNMEFITVDDIDEICRTVIQNAREVTF